MEQKHIRRVGGRRLLTGTAALLCALTLSTGVAYADTDGTEMQVMEPSQLEVQLGPEWAGVEFELRTDAGVYPGTIAVDEGGILSLEIGGSSSYVLSCLNSSVAVPDPNESMQAPATTVPTEDVQEENTSASENSETSAETSESGETTESEAEDTEVRIAGIPVKHLILFGGGLVLAIGALIALWIAKRRSGSSSDSDEDEE